MTSTTLILLAISCVLCSGAIWMLGRSNTQAKEMQVADRLERVMSSSSVLTPEGKDPLKRDYIPQWLTDTLIASGIDVNRRNLALVMGLVVVPALLALIIRGPLEAAGVTILTCMVEFLVFMQRQKKRKEKLLEQLPGFLDSVTRVSAVGYSLTVSFNSAVDIAENPLKDSLIVAVNMQRAGLELDEALLRLAAVYNMTEFKLLASVVRLALTYGGKSDILLGRLGQYLRDREQHRKEMLALSSEARTSAIVMMALSPFVIGIILTFNPEYLLSMWYDATGRIFIYIALGFQMVGGYLMHRMVKNF